MGGASTPEWADLPAYRAAFRDRCPLPGEAPPTLMERRQWLVWRYEPHEQHPEKKPLKVPYYPQGGKRTGGQGGDADRRRLGTFSEARAAAAGGDFDGVGFAFLPGDGLVGVDLDGMVDGDTGEVSPTLQGIVEACASYTEWSPSGKGVHIVCTLPAEVAEALEAEGKRTTFKSNAKGVEVFSGRQYFTFTGRRYGDLGDLADIDLKTMRRLWVTVKGKASEVAALPPVPAQPAKAGGVSLAQRIASVEEALGFLDADEYDQWIKMGLALHELGAAGFAAWDAWSARSAKYSAAECAKRWATFTPDKITLGTLFGQAQDAGWVPPWEKAKQRKARAKPAQPPSGHPAGDGPPDDGAPPPAEAPAGGGGGPPDEDWSEWLIYRSKKEISACLANAELILANAQPWQGVIGYDEFAETTVFRERLPNSPGGPSSGQWTDLMDARAAVALQRAWQVEFSPATVGQAVELVAQQHRFHPVRDALEALPAWDGERRLEHWLTDFLNVERTDYVALVGAFFLRGMIKRVYEPGCKFDYCLVLEGEQGLGKSSVARILSWHWFCDTDLDLGNKDSLMALPGHWVYEIAEMGSLMKAEERKQKSFLSRMDDEYRPPYGKRLIKVPRQCVFLGTTNEEEYLKDATGGRRFWPVMCYGPFNLDGLRAAMPQLYAEALHDYRQRERCWPTDDEQARLFTPEQIRRGMAEPFEDILHGWVDDQVRPFSMADAAIDGMKMTADKLTPAMVTRIGIVLKTLGCVRIEDRNAADKSRRRLYLSPKGQIARNKVTNRPAQASDVPAHKGAANVPF